VRLDHADLQSRHGCVKPDRNKKPISGANHDGYGGPKIEKLPLNLAIVHLDALIANLMGWLEITVFASP